MFFLSFLFWNTLQLHSFLRIRDEGEFLYTTTGKFHLRVINFDLGSSASEFTNNFFLISWSGVRLIPLGMLATNWPIVPATDDIQWVWSSRWNENWQGKPKYSEKTGSSATSSTTNRTWPGLGSNPSRSGGKPATNRLSYGTAQSLRVGFSSVTLSEIPKITWMIFMKGYFTHLFVWLQYEWAQLYLS
jgi:hypothetical protein